MNLLDVNWIGVVGAALCGFLVGGIWYGPVMGKRWMGAVGLTEEQIGEGNMGLIYGGAFAFSLLASWTLAHTFHTFEYNGVELSVAVKVVTALGVAVGFIIPALCTLELSNLTTVCRREGKGFKVNPVFFTKKRPFSKRFK